MQSAANPQQAELIAFPRGPEARLRVALRQLDTALSEQRQAVASFRRELASLGGTVSELQGSASELNARLAEAAEDTLRAQAAASRLLATAEAMGRLG